MKTATMTTPPLPSSLMATGGTKASESAIDAYATRVLESMSPPDALIDTSVGPYVTSLLRCADIQDKNQVAKLVEYESLLELLEDQCNMDQKTATGALERIADAVASHVIPVEPGSSSSNVTSTKISQVKLGPYPGGGLDSFQSLRYSPSSSVSANDPQNSATSSASGALPSVQPGPGTEALDPYTSNFAGGPTPLKPDNLIPYDLFGLLDDPSPDHQRQKSQPTVEVVPMLYSSPPPPVQSLHHHCQQSPTSRIPETRRQERQQDDFPPLSKSLDSFPPLGATSTDAPKKNKLGSSRKSGSGKNHQHSDKNLAAALFRPARPRQNSIENEDAAGIASSSIRPRGQGVGSGSDELEGHHTNVYFQHQLSSCVEILLSMNQDLSEESATEAALLANADFNIAHYLVDTAMTAPPICRHLLHEGCYRSDCQFSHDVEGHTCLFWIRGRCGKGSSCRFLHGFNEKLLNDIPPENKIAAVVPAVYSLQVQNHYQGMSSPAPMYTSDGATLIAPTGYPGYDNSASAGVDTVDGYSSFSPQPGSWQTPSLADVSSTSTSYSSGDYSFSFANVASKGYEKAKFSGAMLLPPQLSKHTNVSAAPIVRIPQDLWNPHENRDSSVFHIADPLERYHKVATTVRRTDVIDLHFQSTKTFSVVLLSILPLKLLEMDEVWIVTGTGHHVGSKTHQKGGGTLERAVIQWLTDEGYHYSCGKDRNGVGGALLVRR